MTNINEQSNTALEQRKESSLRGVDLNLLTVFVAVMQEENITRAAHSLGMSQPAVSNAVARLKVMFGDELFMRQGRGIQPTQRARQLFDPIRQALQLVRNELPNSVFVPELSHRTFKIAMCNPSDIRFAPKIIKQIAELAPDVQLNLDGDFERDLSEQLRFQEVDFVIDYSRFEQPGYASSEIFSDELVVIASADHPRIVDSIGPTEFLAEKHATLSSASGVRSFYDNVNGDIPYQSTYQGSSLSNLIHVVGESELLTVVPRWLVNTIPNRSDFNIQPFPFGKSKLTGYLTWHESSEKDKGHIWMREQLMQICSKM